MSRKGMSLKKFLLLILICSVVLVLIVFAALWLSGTRYVRYETEGHGTVKFIGDVDKDGLPSDGRVYYADASKADFAYYGEVLELKDGSILQGNLYQLLYDDGIRYIGELDGLLRNGKGSLTFTGGDVYEGEFYYGEMTGEGCYYYQNGDFYKGGFRNGAKWGVGTYVWAAQNGVSESYEGEYENNLRHGEGRYTYSDGSFYEGQYVADAKSGKGIMTFASGDCYEGDFVSDLRSGKGKYTFASGDSYEGDFYKGKMTGFGTYHWASGDRPDYTGYFENGKIVVVTTPTGSETSDEA